MLSALTKRASGVLLHPTSLPGPHGSGDLGVEARRFVDFLVRSEQSYWQMLPVGPPGYGSSPYSAESAFAGSPLLVDLDRLAREGLLPGGIRDASLRTERCDFAAATAFREEHLREAFSVFRHDDARMAELDRFSKKNRAWLDDFALFRALKRQHGGVEWTKWDADLRRRDAAALALARRAHADEIAYARFEQYQFERSWAELHAYAGERGISLIGDLPIFVAHDSADVWQSPRLFQLDYEGMPTVVAGVPPDYFSVTGQRWGNPLYRWKVMKADGYGWWLDRFRMILSRFDAVRLDHFIGFQRYWEIPAHLPTAASGRWMKGPSSDFFRAVKKKFGGLPLVAEDLGAVTPAVKALRDEFELPGIKILQFAFGEDPSAPDFLPHNYARRAVVYPGTHDNDTTCGWFRALGERERASALRYLGSDGREVHWDMIRMAFLSVADTAIVSLQDLLGLGTEARMNTPATSQGNWEWRFQDGDFASDLGERLRVLTRTYGRSNAKNQRGDS
ncbi:MAG: 4-alpha-glucanotransferase [Polyangiaceae bacterium]